mgnify:CR=1 FL=1
MTVEGDVWNPAVQILAWHESLSFEGGGPRTLHLQTLNGLPQKQTVAQSTPYKVIQDGTAIGRLAYPAFPGSIWPGDSAPRSYIINGWNDWLIVKYGLTNWNAASQLALTTARLHHFVEDGAAINSQPSSFSSFNL